MKADLDSPVRTGLVCGAGCATVDGIFLPGFVLAAPAGR